MARGYGIFAYGELLIGEDGLPFFTRSRAIAQGALDETFWGGVGEIVAVERRPHTSAEDPRPAYVIVGAAPSVAVELRTLRPLLALLRAARKDDDARVVAHDALLEYLGDRYERFVRHAQRESRRWRAVGLTPRGGGPREKARLRHFVVVDPRRLIANARARARGAISERMTPREQTASLPIRVFDELEMNTSFRTPFPSVSGWQSAVTTYVAMPPTAPKKTRAARRPRG